MIKRFIKKQIFKSNPTSVKFADDAFIWVINAPFRKWITRLWCVKHGGYVDYKELYDWVTKP